MEWRDEAIILNVRPHGETSAIVEVMTREHGRHMGRVKGGRTKRWQPVLQMGNRLNVHWWARLDEHLGSFRIEAHDFVAAKLIDNQLLLYAIHAMCAHLRLLPERDPHRELYERGILMLESERPAFEAAEIFARFELQLLSNLGFGIDLSRCAATGTVEDLIYVSPRSGRAVCRSAGQAWHDKLLALPQFLFHSNVRPSHSQALIDAFYLTGFFLARHIWQPRALTAPLMRTHYLQHLSRTLSMS